MKRDTLVKVFCEYNFNQKEQFCGWTATLLGDRSKAKLTIDRNLTNDKDVVSGFAYTKELKPKRI